MLFWSATIIGTIIYYFLAQAFKVDFFTLEILIHNLAHFSFGFVAFAILVLFQARYKFKILLVVAAIVVTAGLIITHERNVDSDGTDLTMVVYNFFLFFWGSTIGYIFANKTRAMMSKRAERRLLAKQKAEEEKAAKQKEAEENAGNID